jgi:hypothetical protein
LQSYDGKAVEYLKRCAVIEVQKLSDQWHVRKQTANMMTLLNIAERYFQTIYQQSRPQYYSQHDISAEIK